MKTRGRVLVLPAMILALLLALGGAHQVLGEHKDVAGGKHDVATGGTPACIYCHVPRDAAGQLLWPGGEPDPNGALAGQKRLCFSCHDGTVTADRSYVFDPTRPEHLRNPGVAGQDCDRCHDPHQTSDKDFLKIPFQANFCANCHFKAGPVRPSHGSRPAGVRDAAGGHPIRSQGRRFQRHAALERRWDQPWKPRNVLDLPQPAWRPAEHEDPHCPLCARPASLSQRPVRQLPRWRGPVANYDGQYLLRPRAAAKAGRRQAQNGPGHSAADHGGRRHSGPLPPN